jgi:hypothetical protein
MMDTAESLRDLARRVGALENPTEIRLRAADGATELVARSNGIAIFAAGKIAAALTVRKDGSVLTLYTPSGEPAVGIDVAGTTSAVRFFDAGAPRAEIQVVDGVPELYLLDGEENRRVEFDVAGGANFVLSDGSGQARIQLSVPDRGDVVTRLK